MLAWDKDAHGAHNVPLIHTTGTDTVDYPTSYQGVNILRRCAKSCTNEEDDGRAPHYDAQVEDARQPACQGDTGQVRGREGQSDPGQDVDMSETSVNVRLDVGYVADIVTCPLCVSPSLQPMSNHISTR